MDSFSSSLGRTLVLVAHPDDEAAGSGGLIQRLLNPIIVFATDGAPRDEFFWKEYGSRVNYASLRQREAHKALSLAGVREIVFLADESGLPDVFVDQELHRALSFAVPLLGEVIRRYRPNSLLTMAYEGGHPDHDCCSFLASVLANEHTIPVWEFPLYNRARSDKGTFQQFVNPVENEVRLDLTPDERKIKRRMMDAYASQHLTLARFDLTEERFRRQHAYDYSRSPHEGVLNYEAWGWPITSRDVCTAFERYGLPRASNQTAR